MARVLVFSDTHYPFGVEGFVDFLKVIYKKYDCDTVVHCGDLVDFHAVSCNHEPEPDAKDADTELDNALIEARKLYKAFPKVKLVLGNHDVRVVRAAARAKLTPRMVVPFRELLEVPKTWEISDSFVIDDVLYSHGEGYSGAMAHRTKAMTEMMSCVIGHLHSFAGISYIANTNDLVWGMNVGCSLDRKTYASRYATNMKFKPTIGCGIVINGKPFYETMDLGSKVKRSRA
jgi:predicted phosphodiesterase